MGWGKNSKQTTRFAVLADLLISKKVGSVLDVGCGFGDLHPFLKSKGWKGHYTGIDIVPGLLEIAKKQQPDTDLRNLALAELASDERWDYVIASGIFNARLLADNNLSHIEKTLTQMFQHANEVISSDFLSTHVDYQEAHHWHTDPTWAFNFASSLSRRVLLRHDYLPFEFSLSIFKKDTVVTNRYFDGLE